MTDWDDFQVQRFRNAPNTGNTPQMHADHHGPARRRGWIIPAIVVGLIAIFVAMLALNPTDNNDEPTGIAPAIAL